MSYYVCIKTVRYRCGETRLSEKRIVKVEGNRLYPSKSSERRGNYDKNLVIDYPNNFVVATKEQEEMYENEVSYAI